MNIKEWETTLEKMTPRDRNALKVNILGIQNVQAMRDNFTDTGIFTLVTMIENIQKKTIENKIRR
jgi:hypothetical protein